MEIRAMFLFSDGGLNLEGPFPRVLPPTISGCGLFFPCKERERFFR